MFSKNNPLVKNIVLMHIFAYLVAPVGYLIKILYARSFSLEEFGLIYAVIGFIGLISIFNDFGFSETLNYFLTRFYAKKQFAQAKGSLFFAFMMQFSTAVILIISFYVLSPFLAENYFKTDLAISTFRWFLIYMFALNIGKPFIELFRATHQYYINNLDMFLKTAFILALSALMIFLPPLQTTDYIGLVWGVGYASTAIGFYFLSKKRFPEIYKVKADLSFKLYKKLFKYAIIVIVGGSAFFILSRTDILLLTYFKTTEQVGIYSVGLSLASIVFAISSPIVGLIFPLTSRLSLEKGKKKIHKMLKYIYRIGLFFTLPILTLLMAFPGEVTLVLFGNKYLAAKSLILILAPAYFISFISTLNINIMAGLGLIKERTRIFYVGAAINLVLGLILIPEIGIIGAAISTLISFIFILIATISITIKHLKISLETKVIIKIVILNGILLGIIHLLKATVSLNVYAETILFSLIGGGIYLIGGHLLKVFSLDDAKSFLRKLK